MQATKECPKCGSLFLKATECPHCHVETKDFDKSFETKRYGLTK